jgi:hypothetical protein
MASDIGVLVAEAWNGGSWTLESVSSPSGSSLDALNAVSCSSASACVAVGSYQSGGAGDKALAEVWDGHSWSLSTAIPGDLTGVSCSSPT